MPTAQEFFLTEAKSYLDRLDALLASADETTVDPGELKRLCRGLRGSAQLAGDEPVLRVAAQLQTVARALESGELAWDEAVAGRVRDTVADLRGLVDDEAGAPAADAALRRWSDLGDGGQAATEAPDPSDASEASDAEARDFRQFVGREVAGLLTVLETAVPGLARQPRDREPLKAILRRQRALQGAAGLERLPAVAETLATLDDVTRLVARLDVAVEGGWMELYRCARGVLGEVVSPLERGEAPTPPDLSRLRGLRERLLESEHEEAEGSPAAPAAPPGGQGAEVSDEDVAVFRAEARTLLDRIERMANDLAAASSNREAPLRRELRTAFTAMRDTANTFGFADAARLAEQGIERARAGGAPELLDLVPRIRGTVSGGEADGAPEEVVSIDALLYRGPGALERALELRSEIERAAGGDASAREKLDELFDLIRLGMA